MSIVGDVRRVAIVHTRYRQRGGEDVVADSETALLRSGGLEVHRIDFDNADLVDGSPLRNARTTIWNASAVARVRDELAAIDPDVVHVHNTFPLASPGVFDAAKRYPLVHTLHNYRWACPAATLLRNGVPCEACVGRIPFPGVLHGCYRGSRSASAVVAAALTLHRWRGTLRHVDRFIALTAFARGRVIAGGLPSDRVAVKPNFTEPGRSRPAGPPPAHLLFVGRLTSDKGTEVLARAWHEHHATLPPLRIVGDGPERARLEGVRGLEVLGARTSSEVGELLRAARALVMPSIWYEGLPLVILEALAAGLPIIASDIGSLSELVRHDVDGWKVPAGDATGLAAAARAAAALDDTQWRRRSEAALERYRRDFTPERNLDRLLEVYAEARTHAMQRRGSRDTR